MLFQYKPKSDGEIKTGRYFLKPGKIVLYFNHYRIPIVREINIDWINVSYTDLKIYVVTSCQILIYYTSETNFISYNNNGDSTPSYCLPRNELNYFSMNHDLDHLDLYRYKIIVTSKYFVASGPGTSFMILKLDGEAIEKYTYNISVSFSNLEDITCNGILILRDKQNYLTWSYDSDCINLGTNKPLLSHNRDKFLLGDSIYKIDQNSFSFYKQTVRNPRWYNENYIWESNRVYDLDLNFIKTSEPSTDYIDQVTLLNSGKITDGNLITTPVVDYLRLVNPGFGQSFYKRSYGQRLMVIDTGDYISEFLINLCMALPEHGFEYYIDRTSLQPHLTREYENFREVIYNPETRFNIRNLDRNAITLGLDVMDNPKEILLGELTGDYIRCHLKDCDYKIEHFVKDFPDSMITGVMQGKYIQVAFILLDRVSKSYSLKHHIKDYENLIQAGYEYHLNNLRDDHPLDFANKEYLLQYFVYLTLKYWKITTILKTVEVAMRKAESPVVLVTTPETKDYVSAFFKSIGYLYSNSMPGESTAYDFFC